MLYNGEALEVMDELIAKGITVDAIITDPPYGTVKGLRLDGWGKKSTQWDTEIDFKDLNVRFDKILKESSPLILFGQEPFTSKTINSSSSAIPFSYKLIWVKDHFANPLCAKVAPVNYFEEIMVFFKKYDTNFTDPNREYSKMVMDYIGLPKIEILRVIGSRVDHFFRHSSTQFSLPTEETYNELISVYGINNMDGFKELKELKELKKTFNLPEGKKIKSNILEYKKDYSGHHPTQKPVALMEDLIKTYTNEGDTVLDFTMGSGSTGVACKNTNRKFIGIEMDKGYFDIAKDRIEGIL